MKAKIIVLLVIVFAAMAVYGQTPEDVYRKPLLKVLSDVEKQYNVKIKSNFSGAEKLNVEFATWRFTSDVNSTLNNIVKPLDLVVNPVGDRAYEISPYYFYRRSEEEGKKHLNQLLQAYPNAAAFEERKAGLRKSIAQALGINFNAERTPLKPIFRKKKVMDGYTVENIAFESFPGYYVTGSLYRPVKVKGPSPVVLNPQGHFYNEANPSISKDSGRYRDEMQYRCAALAKMGCTVLNYDMYSWGESALFTGGFPYHFNGIAAAIQTWNSIRALDFILALPGVDKSRVGVTGASGGGTQTFLLAALDDRVTLSAPVVMVSSAFYGGCPCESGLPIHEGCCGYKTNNTEIAAMVAPKPLLLVSDGADWTTSVPGTDFPYLQTIYGFYNKRENVESYMYENEQHDYGISKRKSLYQFLAKWWGLDLMKISNKNKQIDDTNIKVLANSEQLVFPAVTDIPGNAFRSHDQIVEGFRKLHNVQ